MYTKRIFTIILFSLFAARAMAQQVLFKDDFEAYVNYTIGNGWTHQHSDIIPWTAGIPYLVGGLCFGIPEISRVACIPEACNPGFDRNNIDVFLCSPSINTTGKSRLWLRFDSYFKKLAHTGNPESATVEVSANGGGWTVVKSADANPNTKAFVTYYIDLSAYINVSDLKIGFRYSDGVGNKRGWAIDNVEVFVPADNDLALASMLPNEKLLSFCQIGKSVDHTYTVFNAGTNTVNSFIAHYQQDNGPSYSHTVTGVNILPFNTYTFTHSIPDTVWAAGDHTVIAAVELTGDQNLSNDILTNKLYGAYTMPPKRIAIEHGTATWNAYAPQGLHLMSQAAKDNQVCPIIVHDTDPMDEGSYSDFLYTVNNTYNYAPFYLFDRTRKVPVDSFSFYVDKYKKHFPFADLYAEAVVTGKKLNINAHIRPATDIHGDYRLVTVITEDAVQGNDTGYSQKNIYAGGFLGPMGGYETKPDPVPFTDMKYDFVARKVLPSPIGQGGFLPSALFHDTTYDYAINTDIQPGWGNKLNATIMLIDYQQQTILNTYRTIFYLDVPQTPTGIAAGIYPNPANTEASLYFDNEGNKKVDVLLTDMAGRLLWQKIGTTVHSGRNELSIPTSQLPAGLYIVNLLVDGRKASMKLQVVH